MMWTPGHFIYLWTSSLESRLHSWGVGVPARSYQKLPPCGTTLPGRVRDLPAVGSFHSRLARPLRACYGVSRLVYVSAYGSFLKSTNIATELVMRNLPNFLWIFMCFTVSCSKK